MTVLEKKVEVKVVGATVKYYEELGYAIPRKKNKNGKLVLDSNAKITVCVDDLPKGSEVSVTRVCDYCGAISENVIFYSLIKNRKNNKDSCFDCGRKRGSETQKLNPRKDRTLEFFCEVNNREDLKNSYSDKNDRTISRVSIGSGIGVWWDCDECLTTYSMSPYEKINKGGGCPYCSGYRVNNTNCLWTVRPDVALLLEDGMEGYRLTEFSPKRKNFICGDCGTRIKDKVVNEVSINGLSCHICSDGYSFSEKFVYNLFKQLQVGFDFQRTFEWSNNKIYDFYIPCEEAIIETHGRQHYENVGGNFDPLEIEQENDRFKKEQALRNGVKHYIVLNCSKTNLNSLKNEIINSKLSELYDLNNINWLECFVSSNKSLIKKTCEIWSSGEKNLTNIGKILGLTRSTVRIYLHKGRELGWCDYNPAKLREEKGQKLGTSKGVPVVQLEIKDGSFIAYWDNMRIAGESTGTNSKAISANCREKGRAAGGFRWMYKEDYDKLTESN